jgi:hypothetical protein
LRNVSGQLGTYLVDDNEEAAVGQDGPDEDVAKDASHQAVRVGHHDGTIPVDGHKGPSQRRRHDGCMDETRVGVVAEVKER